MAGFCEHGNELSGCMKGGELLESLSDCQLVQKDSAAWRGCGPASIPGLSKWDLWCTPQHQSACVRPGNQLRRDQVPITAPSHCVGNGTHALMALMNEILTHGGPSRIIEMSSGPRIQR
jgi:hypothetical protein